MATNKRFKREKTQFWCILFSSTIIFCLLMATFSESSALEVKWMDFNYKVIITVDDWFSSTATGRQEPIFTHSDNINQPTKSSDRPPLFEVQMERLETAEIWKEFPTFLTCHVRNENSTILCKLKGGSYCQTVGPAEVITDFWAIGPMYAYDQEMTQDMYDLHNNFRDYIKSIGMSFSTIEGIRKDLDQTYKVTRPGNEPYEIQINIYDQDYIRENLINVALKKIPQWEYVAWIDGHQYFENIYWWEESILKMEKFGSVQPYKITKRMSMNNRTVGEKQGAIALSIVQNTLDHVDDLEYGNAYVLRRELYYEIGTILDTCIASGCDLSYVLASIPPECQFSILDTFPNYSRNFIPWIEKVRSVFKGKRAYIRGPLVHFEHAKYFDYKQAAKYYDNARYDANKDIARDENGTIKIINPKIRDIIPNLQFFYYHDLNELS